MSGVDCPEVGQSFMASLTYYCTYLTLAFAPSLFEWPPEVLLSHDFPGGHKAILETHTYQHWKNFWAVHHAEQRLCILACLYFS